MEPPRTLAQFPFVTVRIRCCTCPTRLGVYRLARLAERYGAGAPLDVVLYELTRSCRWQVPPGTKRRKYMPFCLAEFCDLGRDDPDEPPPDPSSPAAAPPVLRIVGGKGS